MTSAPAIKPIVTPVWDGDEEAAANARLAVGDAAGRFFAVDTRGDGFTEDVGVGDTGTTVGLAAAVAVGFGLVRVGVGGGGGLGSLIVTRTSGSTTYPLPKQPEGLLR